MGADSDRIASRIARPALALVGVLVAGTVGYVSIERWSLLDALYMAVITIASVGFGEVHPLSERGRVFTIVLILLGVSAISYALTTTATIIVEGELSRRWRRRRMERRVRNLRDHYILCGYGRVGRQIAREFVRAKERFVVIDVNQASVERAAADGRLTVAGNATEDEVLRDAGISAAKGLIAAIADDSENIFLTLSARALNPGIAIVARANYSDAIPKLRRAGADRVVSPYHMAGQQMALLAVRPLTVDFVETLLHGRGDDLILEDLRIASGSSLIGHSVAATRSRFAAGPTVLALRRDGGMLAPPPGDTILQEGDVIVVAGADSQLREVESACAAYGRQARGSGPLTPGAA